MSIPNSKAIESNQSGLHQRLEETVRKHLAYSSRKPIAAHTLKAFEHMQDWIGSRPAPLILDACCGVGESSRRLATTFPGHLVVGIDKSASRLSREHDDPSPDNLLLLRADLNDFYRLLVRSDVQVERHYILYPNPWPKAVHLGRRWHGAPAFADIVAIAGRLELRSNWRTYLEEFQLALEIAGTDSCLDRLRPASPITPFEAKYHASGHKLWRLVAEF